MLPIRLLFVFLLALLATNGNAYASEGISVDIAYYSIDNIILLLCAVLVIFSLFITAIVYPVSGFWKWGGGWLDQMGFYEAYNEPK